MSLTDNSSYRRTRTAILEGAKSLIAERGIRATTMIDIADRSEVSRATLYNHFRDKGTVLRGVIESETQRLCALIAQSPDLTQPSIEISHDGALAMVRNSEPEILARLVSTQSDPLWQMVEESLKSALGSQIQAQLAMRWLIGQVFAPLTQAQSHEQALAIKAALAGLINQK